LVLVDEDTTAFNKLMDALAPPGDSAWKKAARAAAIQLATKGAAEIPLGDGNCIQALPSCSEMAEKGNWPPSGMLALGCWWCALVSKEQR
jgi:glutamate formiminotransferase/formiminotetrahydrofolate cyclodeaminase